MPFAFFQIPADASPELAAPLNAFLRSHRVVRVSREWSATGQGSTWVFCVEYLDGPAPAGADVLMSKVDYKEILPPEIFEIFSRLRNLRKTISERDGQPVFAIFTNAQLAEIAQRGCQTLAELKTIAGIGEARIAKYGAEVLSALAASGGGGA